MTTTTAEDQQEIEGQQPVGERDYGALGHLLTFEEIDDAIDTLERILALRTAQRAARSQVSPFYALSADPERGLNDHLASTIGQLREARRFDAIPETALDAAIEAAGNPPAGDTGEDDDQEPQP